MEKDSKNQNNNIMKPPFHYAVMSRLIRIDTNGEVHFDEITEEFAHKSPIIARNNAFNRYQSYLDVFLEAKNSSYLSYEHASSVLRNFVFPSSKKSNYDRIGNEDFDQKAKFNGIGVFLVVNEPVDGISIDPHLDDLMIHGIGRVGMDDPQSFLFCLIYEYKYYQHYGFDTNNQEMKVRFRWYHDFDTSEIIEPTIIQTPLDWTGLDKPMYAESRIKCIIDEDQEPDELIEVDNNNLLSHKPIDEDEIKKIISEGESNQVEFKPALLYNFSTGKPGISIKGIIAKTICAFLNSRGGMLFIGIDDQGVIKGLDYDFSLAGEKNTIDYFRLEFDQMLNHFLGFFVKTNVYTDMIEIDEKMICVVTVWPMRRQPVFLNGKNGKEFYVRGEASTKQLTDIEQIAKYCLEQWGID